MQAQEPTRPDSRERILSAAKKIFFEQGFEAANLDDVARDAGLAKGTIYRYFESKAELYVEVLVSNADDFVARMRETVDPALDPVAQIRAIGVFYVQHYAKNSEYFRIFWALENQRLIGGLPEDRVRAVTGLWKECLEILAKQIERGVELGVFRPCDPWETANVLWIIGNGLLQTEGDPERRALRGRDLATIFEHSLELFIRGLQAKPE